MQSTDDELPAQVIDTEDYTEADDEPEEGETKASVYIPVVMK